MTYPTSYAMPLAASPPPCSDYTGNTVAADGQTGAPGREESSGRIMEACSGLLLQRGSRGCDWWAGEGREESS